MAEVIDIAEKADGIDERAVSAKDSMDEAEQLIADFNPFLHGRAARYAKQNDSQHREDLFSIAMEAFYEAIQNYDIEKGHFFPFADRVVRERIIDSLRKQKKAEENTVTLADDDDDDDEHLLTYSAAVDKVSMRAYAEELSHEELVDEIEQFKAELATWGITMDSLAKSSPKHSARRVECKAAVEKLAQDRDIMHTIEIKRYFPIKTASEVTGLPPKKLERARIYILALLIIMSGDYDQLSDYIK